MTTATAYAQSPGPGHQAAPARGAASAGAAKGAPQPQKDQAQPRFDIWEFRVSGNTLLKRQVVERTVYPYLGPSKTIKDVEKARKALEKRYRKAGYATVLVNIPQQKVDKGIVRLKVIEGKVGRVLVTGSHYFSLQQIRAEVPALKKGRVPYLPKVQQQLVALNNVTPDRSITPVLRPGRTPGTVEVDLKVNDHFPLHGSLTLDDYNSIDTSSLRLSGMLRYDNLWQKEHSLSIQYLTSPEDASQVKVWSGTYLARSAFTRNLLAFYAVHSDSNIAAVGALAVVGKGDIAGMNAIFPLPGTRDYTHNVTVGVAYKHFKQNVLLLGSDNLRTPIEYVPFTVQYQGTKFGDNATTQFGASVHFGIRGLVNSAREFENKRYNSKPNYFYLRARVEHRQRLYRGIGLRLEAKGQLADSPLISNEEFSAGGPGSVRGYHRSERFGDDAIQGTVELLSPQLMWGSWAAHVQEFRALAFWDGAALWVKDALPGQPGRYVLTSAGIGLRFSAWRHFDASLEWAQVYHTTLTVKKDTKRIVFKVEYSF